MKRRPGILANYRQTPTSDGGVTLSGPESFVAAPNQLIHFDGDHSDWIATGGKMVRVDGAASATPAQTKAALAKVIADLQAIAAGL